MIPLASRLNQVKLKLVGCPPFFFFFFSRKTDNSLLIVVKENTGKSKHGKECGQWASPAYGPDTVMATLKIVTGAAAGGGQTHPRQKYSEQSAFVFTKAETQRMNQNVPTWRNLPMGEKP